jgi:four helix bundle protein
MNESYPLDHERLDVYRLAVEFAAWVGEAIDDGPLKGCKISAVKHLDDSSRSIINNIAEGNGKRSLPDRCRFLDISRGSALECASCLDILVARKRLPTEQAAQGKAMLVRIVSRWITGEMTVSHHLLSRFRVGHGDALEKLMTDVLGALLHRGLLDLRTVAQDGTRLRASASAPSFRTEPALEQCLEQARLHLRAVLAQSDDPELSAAQKAAREAAARDYERRVLEAIATVQTLRPTGKSKARASTTDPEARVMKMGDGGFRPGYNLQLAVAGSPLGGPRTIVGLKVHNVGSDMSSVAPMVDDIERRTGQTPRDLLADANHVTLKDIEHCAERGVRFMAPVPVRMQDSSTSHPAAVDAWIADMATEDARQQLRARASLCELANAQFKGRFRLDRVLVRRTAKLTCVALLAAIAFNLLQHAQRLLT